MPRSNASAYMSAAEAIENVGSYSAITPPSTAWQARPLTQDELNHARVHDLTLSAALKMLAAPEEENEDEAVDNVASSSATTQHT
jgi:hypothetical protein